MGTAALVRMVSKRGSEALGDVPRSFFELSAVDISGRRLDFSTLCDKYRAFLVTNVACKCGLTNPQYRQLVELHKEYHQQGLAVMAFPCNQFNQQEPAPEADIEAFVRQKYNAEFLLFSKIEVNGPNAHPVFRFLRANSALAKTDGADMIPWNFAKFLIDAQGQVVAYARPSSPPRELEGQIRELLGISVKK